MTREEAIEVLRKNRPGADPRRCGLALCTAVEVAIAALMELEKLESNLKVLESSDWISVEERLPEPNTLVLVVFKRHDEIRRRGFGTLQTHGVWYVSNEGMPPVTHWMPVPEPPEVEV